MNERIKKLAGQADLLLDDLPDNILMPLENFAELIIQECIDVVIDCDESPKMILHEPYRTIMNRIDEHFGVEE
jgi:hypothetical protein